MIELGTIRVAVEGESRPKKINVYKDKDCVGEITINVSDEEIEAKLINLIKTINDK